jgi:hypothetical protein
VRPSLASRLRWGALWLALAVLFSARAATRAPRRSEALAAGLDALAWYVPVFLLWGLLALAVVALGRRFPLDGRRRAHLFLHVGAAVGISLGHALVVGALAAPLGGGAGRSAGVEAALAALFHQNYLTYWLVAFGSRALEFARRARDQQVAAARLRQQLAEARLAALRMQLHPHFLFNTLNSIAELVHVDLAAAEQMVRRLESLLGTAIETATDHVVALDEEIAFLRRYLEIETMRFQDRLSVRFAIPSEARALRVPALVLQPLVENAIRHGVGRLRRGGEIEVRATLEPGCLAFEVENDVAPEPAPAVAAGGGVGLRNTSARLAQLYGNDARLTTGLRDGGRRFLARLELPVVGAATPTRADGALPLSPAEVPA